MPKAVVPLARFEQGAFPPVCARTGVPADGLVEIVVRHTPSWVLWMLLFGILPYFVASSFATVTLSGFVPVSGDVLQRRRSAGRVMLVALAAAITLFALGYARSSAALVWLAGAALVVAAVGWVRRWFLAIRGHLGEDVVVLRNAHPIFVEALKSWT